MITSHLHINNRPIQIEVLELISVICLLLIVTPITSEGSENQDDDDTETVTDEVIQKIQSTQLISKKYVKEYNNLKSFKSKVSNYRSGYECVNACKVEVCEKSHGQLRCINFYINSFFSF